MESKILVTELDYVRLVKTINSAKEDKSTEFKNIEYLIRELDRAEKIESEKITPEFITMNSIVQIFNPETQKVLTVKIVYPDKADFKNGCVSVFSPLGSALIGFKKGDVVSFNAPKGKVEVIIRNIDYQPEANGEYLV